MITRSERLLYEEVARRNDDGSEPAPYTVRRRVGAALARVAAWRRYEAGINPVNRTKIAMLDRMVERLQSIDDGELFAGWMGEPASDGAVDEPPEPDRA